MIIIGERINGMFLDVRKAVQTQDKKIIQDLALEQTKCGANYLDVNVGPSSDDPKSAIVWMIEAIREVCDTPISVDVYTKFEIMEAGVKSCAKGKVLINSTNANPVKMEKLFPLAAEWDACIIGLTMDKRGVPADVDYRVETAATVLATAMEYGISTDRIFIDPIINPVNASQEQFLNVMEALDQFKLLADPAPHYVVGLSNLSAGVTNRPLVNRTAITMLMAHGLDAAIIDPMDKEIMDALITAEVLLNKTIFNNSYLEAYRKSLELRAK